MYDHFHQLEPHITEVLVTHHFKRDAPDFDVSQIIDDRHDQFTHLHKFEEAIEGNHIFRALQEHVHYVYVIDKGHRLLFLRAFHNYTEYKKFLDDKKEILRMISSSSSTPQTLAAVQ
jgi:hypothetical protein